MKITINEWCKKCGNCASVCPKNVYSFNELEGPKPERTKDCIDCNMCVIMCPDFAITVDKEEVEKVG
jgi:2-oxoglutarate ferredoxin oxidoreductase subunit delta